MPETGPRTKKKTPLAAAEKLGAEFYRAGIRWDRARGRWMERDEASGVYRPDEVGAVDAGIIAGAAEFDRRDLGAVARFFERVLKCYPGLVVPGDQWDRNPLILGTPRELLDLERGFRVAITEEGGDPLITKQAGAWLSWGVHDWHGDNGCPRWLAFLLESTGGDAELVSYLRRWCGYALSGLTNEHAILFVHGPGGNGKSVFVNTLAHVWGEYARILPVEALMSSGGDRHPAEIAGLHGCRLAICNETTEGRRWDEAKLKSLTGGDRITARFMRQDWFEFAPTHKLLVVGNHAPQLSVVDDAMRRRLQIVPFTRRPANPDPNLESRLRLESAGILAWALEGFQEWRSGGLRVPETVRLATSKYFEVQDAVGSWIEDCCEIREGLFISCRDAFASWAQWAEEGGMQPKSIRRLGDDLEKRGILRHRTPTERGFAGMGLKAPPSLPY